MRILRIIMALAILGLGVYVAVSPALVYASTPQAVLFLLIAILPAILLAAEATAEFKLKLPGFLATGGGSFAMMFIVLFALTHFVKPIDQIAVFRFIDENEKRVIGLEQEGAVEIHTSDGDPLKPLIDGNSIVVFFPADTATCSITVRLSSKQYTGDLTYYGVRKTVLVLKRDGTIK